MNRNTVIFGFLAVGLGVLATILILQNGRLRDDLVAEQGRAGRETAVASADKTRDVQVDALNKRIADLEARLAAASKTAAEKPVAPEVTPKDPKVAKDPDKTSPPDGMSDKMRGIMTKLRSSLPLGEDISEEAAKALGLEPGQVTAVNLATKDENKRMNEALQRFYAENFKADEPGLYEKPGNEVMRLMLGKVMAEVMELSKMPQETAMGIHTGESSLEELLGPDKVASKLAREIHTQRLKTYETLATSLTPDQLAKFRDEYWREGSLYYQGTERYEFGMAPKDMKK